MSTLTGKSTDWADELSDGTVTGTEGVTGSLIEVGGWAAGLEQAKPNTDRTSPKTTETRTFCLDEKFIYSNSSLIY